MPRKIAEILRFLPLKNFKGIFHKIDIAKVLLTLTEANVSYHKAAILWREKKLRSKAQTEARLMAATCPIQKN